MAIYTVLLAVLPWLVGVLVTYSFASNRLRSFSAKEHISFIGLGSYIGQVLIFMPLIILKGSGLQPYSVTIALILMVLFGLISITILCLSNKEILRNPTVQHADPRASLVRNLLIVLLCAYMAPQLLFLTHEAFLRPTVAFDSVAYWSLKSADYIRETFALTPQASTLTDRHPPMNMLIDIWPTLATSGLGLDLQTAPYFHKIFQHLGMLMMLAGVISSALGSMRVGLLIAVLFSSTPLIEAHISLGGYADYTVAQCLAATMTIIAQQKNFSGVCSRLILPALVGVGFIGLKISSLYIGFLILTIYVLCLAAWRYRDNLRCFHRGNISRKLMLFAILVFALGGIIVLSNFAYVPQINQPTTIDTFYQWNLQHRTSILLTSAKNIFSAMTYYSSFTITTATWLILLPWVSAISTKNNCFFCLFTIIAACGYLIFLMVAQNINNGFYLSSLSTSDTGLTRMLLPWIFLAICSSACLLRPKSTYP